MYYQLISSRFVNPQRPSPPPPNFSIPCKISPLLPGSKNYTRLPDGPRVDQKIYILPIIIANSFLYFFILKFVRGKKFTY